VKKLADDIYEITPFEEEGSEKHLMHMCTPPLHKFSQIVLRENEDGPLYWCTGCGFTVDDGLSMAIRLNEVDF